MTKNICLLSLVTVFVSGCVTDSPGTEHGVDNTVAYNVLVEASAPGTKIEVNYKPAGVAPLTIKIFGDRDGTFHNFGSDEFIVRAYPANPADFPQTKIFKTGTMGVRDEKIPEKIYFDFGSANKPAK